MGASYNKEPYIDDLDDEDSCEVMDNISETAENAIIEQLISGVVKPSQVKLRTPRIYMTSLSINGYFLRNIKSQTYDYCLEAVTQNGFALLYVKKCYRTSEICKMAVRNNGYALYYVDEQTDAICMDAVNQNGDALFLVKEKTSDHCLAAVIQNSVSLRHVDASIDKYNAICCIAVNKNKKAIQYVKDLVLKQLLRKLYCE